MEWYALVASLCICYLLYTISKMSKKQKQNCSINKTTNLKIQNYNDYKKTNIFREMAIEAIAEQRLVYDQKTGAYIRKPMR